MQNDASDALETAHRYIQDIAQIAGENNDQTVQAMHGLSQVIYHVGRAIMIQLATAPDN